MKERVPAEGFGLRGEKQSKARVSNSSKEGKEKEAKRKIEGLEPRKMERQTQQQRLGSHRRIGMIYPAAGRSEKEFEKLAPESVDVHVTRISFSREDLSQLIEMEKHLDDAVSLLSQAGVDLILFNCTTGSLVKGRGYDEELIKKMERSAGKIPSMTTATAALMALKHLGITKLSLVTAYPRVITELERKFIEDNGVSVVNAVGANITDPFEQAERGPDFWLDYSIRNFHHGSDGLFISCAGIRVVDAISELESKLGVPVVTSNQAAMWACLVKMGVDRRKKGFGSLLEERSRL